MNEIEFTYQDLYEAYRKLKSYFYYDNTSLFIRKQISDYEFELVKQPITYSGAYPFTFRQPIKHKIAFKSTILYPFIP